MLVVKNLTGGNKDGQLHKNITLEFQSHSHRLVCNSVASAFALKEFLWDFKKKYLPQIQ
jgi:hypothetical protein